MDQDAFRNMLASGSGSSSSTSHRSRGVLGGSAPKRGGWGIKAKPGHEYKPPKDEAGTSFIPRSQKKKGKDAKSETDSKYMDRAERRRQGLDDEYKPVEQLLEDLERRQKEEGVDQDEFDKQRAYLGGDATHSILVKGLDYALLARRKAEIAAQGEEIADEELDALVAGAGSKSRQSAADAPKTEEKMAKGFKSIAAKDKVEEKPKKKKKKKVKAIVESGPSAQPKVKEEERTPVVATVTKAEPSAASTLAPAKPPSMPPIDDDEDIFGDVGAYDLTQGLPDDGDSDSDEDDAQVEHAPSIAKSRSGSLDREETSRHSRRDRSASLEHYRHRDRAHSRDRHHYRDADRYRSRSRDGHRRQDRSDSRDRYEDWRSSYRRERDGEYDTRGRYDARDRHGWGSPDRHERGRRHDHRSDRYEDIESRPYRRSRSASRSPPPTAKRPRQATRSPSPLLFDPLARAPSPTPSDSDNDEHLVNGKLQPLQSSAIADVKGFLSAEAAALKAEEKKAKKAKWRARQGLAVQEGTESYLEREVGDKEKLNRDYVKVMGKLKKDEEKKDS